MRLPLLALLALLQTQCAWSDNSGIVAISGLGEATGISAQHQLSSLPRNTPNVDSSTLSTVIGRVNTSGKPHKARLIASAMRAVSAVYGVPRGLLQAISLTESGVSGRPWPWTLNVYGQAYRYSNEKQTVAAVKKFLARGITLVDIGPMQVDWQYHGWRFGSVRAAANPLRNVAVAARILRDAFAQTGSWVAAVGQYHGGDTSRQQTYIRQVMSRWHSRSWGGSRTFREARGINLIPAKTDSIVAMSDAVGNY